MESSATTKNLLFDFASKNPKQILPPDQVRG